MYDRLRRLVGVALDIAPGLVRERGVCLPWLGANIAQAAAFEVERRRAIRHVVEFVEERDRLMPRGGVVVVVGGEALQVAAEVRLADPPVEVNEVGMIALNDLGGASEPVVHVGLRYISEVMREIADIAIVPTVQLRRPVKGGVLRIVHIGGEVTATVEEPVMLRAMR